MKSKFVLCIIFNLFIFFKTIKAQCIASAVRHGSIASVNSSIGLRPWNNIGGALGSDNSYAFVTAVLIGDQTNYLNISGFGFSISPSATICGIVVEVESKKEGLFASVWDNSVKIMKSGNILGSEMAWSTWGFSDTYNAYATSTELWGTTWTVDDINASDFGVAISANLGGVSVLPTAKIDDVRMTVYYKLSALPIELLNFEVERLMNHSMKLSWITGSEKNNKFFVIERSLDGENWTSIDTVDGAGNSNDYKHYSYIDYHVFHPLTYYRLKQTDYDGNFNYSKITTVGGIESEETALQIYPNPISEELHIYYKAPSTKKTTISLLDVVSGKTLIKQDVSLGNVSLVDTKELSSGIYTLMIDDGFTKKYLKLIKEN